MFWFESATEKRIRGGMALISYRPLAERSTGSERGRLYQAGGRSAAPC
jgi:hypothetical protein